MRYWMKAPNKCFQMNPKLCQGTIVTRRYFTFKVFQLLAALTLTARISAPPPSSGSNQVWPSTATLLPPGCLSSDVCLSQQPAAKILKLSDDGQISYCVTCIALRRYAMQIPADSQASQHHHQLALWYDHWFRGNEMTRKLLFLPFPTNDAPKYLKQDFYDPFVPGNMSGVFQRGAQPKSMSMKKSTTCTIRTRSESATLWIVR